MTSHKTALVTGASRGIGKAIAQCLAQDGYHLTLTCFRSISALEEYSRQLQTQYGILCRAVQADAGSWKEMEAVFSNMERLDLLVNNAGISYMGLLTDMTPEEWQRIMDTNLNACFYTSRLAIPLMLRRRAGRIINISSVWGSAGASMETAYSASKGGVNALTRALAKELAPSNIQVNAIACGVIDTEMNDCLTSCDKEALRQEIPADRLGTPEEVARLVLQTAHAPAYMTGQIITIDGGWL